MKWIRTFPVKIPDNRNYVVDNIPVVYMDRNYLVILENLIDDTVIVEWDIAFSLEDIQRFEKHIADSPDRVHTAPYKLYNIGTGKPEWAHRKFLRPPDFSQFVSTGEPESEFFGFGMTYLPLAIVQQYLETKPQFTDDCVFAEWHRKVIGTKVPIHWDVHPVHLHY
jgi:hypothetical protein